MSKFYMKVLLGGIAFLFLLFPFSHVEALTIENFKDSENQVIAHDTEGDLMILGGKQVTIEGDVNGDLIIISDKVNVTGTVEGNVYAIGGRIVLQSIVGKTIYMFGGEVEVDGEITRDAFVFSDQATLNGAIGEDVNTMGRQILVNASVGDDVRVAGTTAKINNSVGGDVVSLTNNLQISGNVMGGVYNSEDIVPGNIHTPTWRINWMPSFENMFFTNLWMKTFLALFQSVGLVIVGILLFKFAPIRVEETVSRMNDAEEFIKSALVGFLAYPVGMILGFILLLSVFGWPLFKVLVLLAFLATSLVTPIAGIWFGRKVLPLVGSKRRYVIAVTVGVVLIQLLKLVPILGWMLYTLLTFAVLGALLRMQWSKYQVAQNLSIKMRK